MIGDTRIDSIEQNRIVVVNMGVREMLDIALTARDVPATAVASQAPPAEPVKVGVGEARQGGLGFAAADQYERIERQCRPGGAVPEQAAISLPT